MNSAATRYWTQTRWLTAILLVVWVVVTFVANWYADEMNGMVVFGFPLGFYMSAQGSLVIYLFIIWLYNRVMRRLDAKYGADDQ